jgi:hypothetical protein
MRSGQIAVQLQRMLALDDGLVGALGEHVDKAQPHMGQCVIGSGRKGLVQTCFRSRIRRLSIGDEEIRCIENVRHREADLCVNIVGIGRQRAIVEIMRFCHILRGQSLVQRCQALK